MKRQSIALLTIAAIAAIWVIVAAYRSHTSGVSEPTAGLGSGGTHSADNSPRLDIPNASTAQPENHNSSLPAPAKAADTLPPRPGPEKEADSPYGRGMRLGSSHLALIRETPLEWIRRCLEAVPEVELLTIGCALLTPELIALLGEMGNIKHISFMNAQQLSTEAAAALSGLVGVREISLGAPPLPFQSGSPKTEEEFNPFVAPILSMPDMTSLETRTVMTVNDDFLKIISESRQITRLVLHNYADLRRSGCITTAGLQCLSRMSQLRELDMTDFTVGRHKIDLGQLATILSGFSSLERLSLSGWQVKDEHLLPCLPTLARLKYLNVQQTQLTDAFFQRVDSSWSLEELVASGMEDSGLQAVVTAPRLRRLDVQGTKVTDSGLHSVGASAVRLEAINISDCPMVTDAGLSGLQSCASLRELSIGDVRQVTDEAVLSVAAANRLVALDVSELKFVNRSFIESLISGTPSLTRLTVFRCTNLPKKDLETLIAKHPSIAFHGMPGLPWSK